MKLYRCLHCGNVATKIYDKKMPLFCCGEQMKEMVANSVDAAKEKHVPVLSVEGNTLTVNIGEVAHPMEKAHYITSIYVENAQNTKMALLDPADNPVAKFLIDPSKPLKAYAYCNVHGLWTAKL